MGFKIEDGVLVKYIESVFPKPDVVIPENVKKIGPRAFVMCTSVKSISFPIGVTEIGMEAFKGCTALEEINLPIGIKKLGAEAFRNCSSLKSIVIPVGVPEIREYTFCNCLSLKSVGLPDYLTNIEMHSFYGCKALESVEIPSGITVINDFVFCGCNNLTGITIPETVTKIGNSSFWGCSELKELSIPPHLREIGDFAFRDCVGLSELDIPDSVEKIGKDAFDNCPQLKIILPRDYHKLRGSFAGCKVKEREEPLLHLSLDLPVLKEGDGKAAPTEKVASDIKLPEGKTRKPFVKGFTDITKPKYYRPGSILQTKNIKNYDITNTPLSWERVPLPMIEKMIETRDYDADMYLPMKYSIVAAVFLKDRQPEAASYIWRNTLDFISFFINLNDYQTVKGLFQCGKFITSRNILPLLECAIDKVQNGGDMKIQVLINNYYLMNKTKTSDEFVNEQYSEETRAYLHELDIIERSIADLRMMLKAGADRSEIAAGANELFGVFADFRATLPDELSDLFNSFSSWQ